MDTGEALLRGPPTGVGEAAHTLRALMKGLGCSAQAFENDSGSYHSAPASPSTGSRFLVFRALLETSANVLGQSFGGNSVTVLSLRHLCLHSHTAAPRSHGVSFLARLA